MISSHRTLEESSSTFADHGFGPRQICDVGGASWNEDAMHRTLATLLSRGARQATSQGRRKEQFYPKRAASEAPASLLLNGRKRHAGGRNPRERSLGSTGPTRQLRLQQQTALPVRPRLRVANARVGALLSSRMSSQDCAIICDELRQENEVELLSATEPNVWNIALQNRLKKGDVDGAIGLLDLLLGFAAENTDEKLWTDLLFTLMRQPSRLSSQHEIIGILSALQRKCGDEFVASIAVSLANGCAAVKMFEEARFVARFHRQLNTTTTVSSRIMGNLITTMHSKGRHKQVVAFIDELLEGEQSIPIDQIQPQVWIALFRSSAKTEVDLTRYVDHVIEWFNELKHWPTEQQPEFQRVLGAVVQSCVASGNGRLALRCFHAMTWDDEDHEQTLERDDEDTEEYREDLTISNHQRLVRPDENIYVNVLKACVLLHDKTSFREIYHRMVRDNVARSAGFGSAIRFCHVHHDVDFLKEVLEDAFTVEDASPDEWFLPLEQYNDALGCFAETRSYIRARMLFARLLDNPRLKPTHITMVEMVENYREAPFSEVFELMEVFLEFELTPNMQVFTSLLAICGRHRLMADAAALVSAMKQQRIKGDVKTFTAIAFIYGTHGHLTGLVDLVKEMRAEGVATDQVFFDVVLDGLFCENGTDMCFSLFREMVAAGLCIPEGMYRALVRMGTKVGLVERTLHVAYNMECDGFALTSEEWLTLMHRCEADTEVAELVRTFLLLHQGRQAPTAADDDTPAQFTYKVYEDMVELLSAFSQRDAANKVKLLAANAGYTLP